MFWSVTLSLLEGLREVVKLFALTDRKSVV